MDEVEAWAQTFIGKTMKGNVTKDPYVITRFKVGKRGTGANFYSDKAPGNGFLGYRTYKPTTRPRALTDAENFEAMCKRHLKLDLTTDRDGCFTTITVALEFHRPNNTKTIIDQTSVTFYVPQEPR